MSNFDVLTFFIFKNLCLTLEQKVFISNVAVYPLQAHGIKFNVNPLTSNQVNCFRADTKKRKFLLITSNKMFHIHSK